jgi:hypothetical protein
VLDPIDVGGIGPFRAFRNLKRHSVAFPKVLEFNVLKLVGVKKEIFFRSFALNESESSVRKSGNCSFLHAVKEWLNNFQIIEQSKTRHHLLKSTGFELASIERSEFGQYSRREERYVP